MKTVFFGQTDRSGRADILQTLPALAGHETPRPGETQEALEIEWSAQAKDAGQATLETAAASMISEL